MTRRTQLLRSVALLIAALVLFGATSVSAQPSPFSTAVPRPGGFGLLVWTGGALDQLQRDAVAAGCAPRAIWTDGTGATAGSLVGYLFAAPAFVNAQFLAIHPAGLPAATPLILVCEPAPPPTPPPGSTFETLPVGAALPSGAACASRIRPTAEVRPGNAVYNATRGTSPHDLTPRVDGDFVGTTDELLQWVACKWGIDEDIVRAQVVLESWWDQTTGGDRTADQSACHPDLRTASGDCPESIGLMQVRYPYHQEAFEDANAIRSSAYNLDYAYAVWRSCYEGELTWLNNLERGAEYAPGDLWGCTGVWFSGRWRTPAALEYNARLQAHLTARTWETPGFLNP